MKARWSVVVVSALVVAGAAGCSGGDGSKAAGPGTAPTPVRSSAAASSSPRPAPTLAVGKPVRVKAGSGSAEVTLVAAKTAAKVTDPSDDYTAKAQDGQVIGCVGLKVRNTATSGGKLGLAPYANPSWHGADGHAAEVSMAAGVGCEGLGVKGDDLNGEPDPGPGEFATGSLALEIPKGAGDLVFSSESDVDMFKVHIAE